MALQRFLQATLNCKSCICLAFTYCIFLAACLWTGKTTPVTFIWFYATLLIQMCLPENCFGHIGLSIWLRSTLRFEICPQVCKIAQAIFVWHFPTVRFTSLLKFSCPWKWLAAFVSLFKGIALHRWKICLKSLNVSSCTALFALYTEPKLIFSSMFI